MQNQTNFLIEKIENFSLFFEKARKIKTNYFLFYFQVNNSLIDSSVLKYAIISSKKGVHKRAVKRNKARRRIRHALFSVLKTFDLPSEIALDIVFMANRSVLSVTWEQLLEEISLILQKSLKEKEKGFERK
ncbi:ribonuclease P protein component [Pigmentibacter sp. JX0631]|uniref:ribonuclease P protein component n=1 Tax=Pigmentibacter sp. JX0631 TaxID=2976982 RepID=UPI0024684D7C|nr:ribonuclease P protein component [Pigmentibacter sp. JX0631]WGL60103.1 ribonuclease P protein component [Pigmentibacter sp. JX0631]